MLLVQGSLTPAADFQFREVFMIHPSGRHWLAVLTLSAALPAVAQGSAPVAANDLSFRSTFEGYRAFTEEKVVPWREANDNVRRIGGWREYAKEAGRAGAQPGS
ncbi:hypothetical protein, partial [Ramlibacter sp.]|uniref:hypothetical protein n=1 Tax=Ramlibacter sp. TaxID=1917967 RepID=UPI0017E35C58